MGMNTKTMIDAAGPLVGEEAIIVGSLPVNGSSRFATEKGTQSIAEQNLLSKPHELGGDGRGLG
jgi:hypothetical protein